jgi:hypothetical protein
MRSEGWGQHDAEVPFTKEIINVTGTLSREKNKWQYACRLLRM